MNSRHLDRGKEVFEIEIEAIREVMNRLDESFDRAVDWLTESLASRNKIVVVGVGKSGNIGNKIVATLNSTGSTAVGLNAGDALHGDLGIISDGDIVMVLSYSGETDELNQLIPAIRRFSVKIISMCCSRDTTLGTHSDLVLEVKVPKEACPFNLAPTSSTTAMLVTGDALAMAVLQARGFRKEDYARFHPSGAIGRALLMKVRDIMRTGDQWASALESATVKDALILMTKARTGSICILNETGKLAGVFTDGDLRRHLMQDTAILEKKLHEVMTPKPIVIGEDALAVEAVKAFDSTHIDDLIVVNGQNEPVGLVESQDLPKMKVL